MTDYLRAEILKVGAELEVPIQVTGLGSLFGIHFTSEELIGYRDIAAQDSAFRHKVFLGLLNEGILMASNLVGAVSTEIGKTEIDTFTSALRRVLERALAPAS
jgi:glutamate-1-semialdehyde aminotransferase